MQKLAENSPMIVTAFIESNLPMPLSFVANTITSAVPITGMRLYKEGESISEPRKIIDNMITKSPIKEIIW